MKATRLKFYIDRKDKVIIQLNGDTADPDNFREPILRPICLSNNKNRSKTAVFKDENNIVLLKITFNETVYVSENILDKGIFLELIQDNKISGKPQEIKTSSMNDFLKKLTRSGSLYETCISWEDI